MPPETNEHLITASCPCKEYTGILKVKQMVENCRLGHAFMQWCIAFAASARFRAVPDELRRVIRDTFSGWIQTRVNEKANKVWRDLGNRANASGVASDMALWEKLTDQDVFGEFERQEVELEEQLAGNGDIGAKPDWNEKDLCSDPKPRVRPRLGATPAELERVAKENEWLATFDKIKDDGGKYVNPESEQKLVAEMQLMRFLHANDIWHKAGDAWVTGLLPVGGLIRIKASDTYTWVLKTNDCAALCWPAEESSTNMWRKARDVKKLDWYTCFAADEVEVLTARVESPKSLFLQDQATFSQLAVVSIIN